MKTHTNMIGILKLQMENKSKEWETKVDKDYPEKEYSGIYESILHLTGVVAYMESEIGKKLIIEEFDDELKYDMQLDLQRKSLKTRQAELKFLKEAFLMKDIKTAK